MKILLNGTLGSIYLLRDKSLFFSFFILNRSSNIFAIRPKIRAVKGLTNID